MNPQSFPKTRKQLLRYLWDNGLDVEIFRCGPHYVIQRGVFQHSMGGLRRIGTHSFERWAEIARFYSQTHNNYQKAQIESIKP